jgi:hypothetical protein
MLTAILAFAAYKLYKIDPDLSGLCIVFILGSMVIDMRIALAIFAGG